jgi:hypothetical protein
MIKVTPNVAEQILSSVGWGEQNEPQQENEYNFVGHHVVA